MATVRFQTASFKPPLSSRRGRHTDAGSVSCWQCKTKVVFEQDRAVIAISLPWTVRVTDAVTGRVYHDCDAYQGEP